MQNLISLLPQAAPRYTSYPSSPHFSSKMGPERVSAWMKSLPTRSSVSLYVHIPFCDTLCWFCGCHTKATRRYEPVKAYLEELHGEMDLVAQQLPEGVRVSHVHFGGGSPTMLSGKDLTALVTKLRTSFAVEENAEFALETDPRDLDVEKLDAIAAAGITRISMGIQDFHPDVQAAINRFQDEDLTRWAVAQCRARGINSINLDLVYGLPEQTTERLLATVDATLDLRPDRIAIFGYAHVPWMKKHMRLINENSLADSQTRSLMAAQSTARIIGAGYRRIGLDHFALPTDSMSLAADAGTLRRNFQGYTTDTADALIGLGASSISNFPQGFAQNEGATNRYRTSVKEGTLPIARGLERTQDDLVRGAAIEMLMCRFEIDFTALRQRFGDRAFALATEMGGIVSKDDGTLIESTTLGYRLTDQGRMHVRQICALLDPYFKTGVARHSQAV